MHDNASKPRRPRFSLLNLLLLTTIAALAVGLYRSKQRNDGLAIRNAELEEENLRHRNELGIYDLVDPQLIHAIRVPTQDDEPRTYRLYLPSGRKYRLGYRANRVPEEGLPEIASYLPLHGGEYALEPGNYLIRIKLNREYKRDTREPHASANVDLKIDPQDGQRFSSTNAGIGFSQERTKWLRGDGGGFSYSTKQINRELETHDPGQPLLLYRARISEVYVRERDSDGEPIRWGSRRAAGVSDGFMAWIESAEGP